MTVTRRWTPKSALINVDRRKRDKNENATSFPRLIERRNRATAAIAQAIQRDTTAPIFTPWPNFTTTWRRVRPLVLNHKTGKPGKEEDTRIPEDEKYQRDGGVGGTSGGF